MKISFHGATREVTGSCYLVETKRARLLIDCGMFQGSSYSDSKNFKDFGFDPSTVDAVALTHGHLDHVGRLPKLVKDRFKGRIYATPPTCDIANIVMENAVQLMRDDEDRESRPPLYDMHDVEQAAAHMKRVDYSRWVTLGDLKFRFRDAGHIFGSAFIEIEEKGGARAAFSGDLGNRDAPYLRPTAQVGTADVIMVESTYGNRIHEDIATSTKKLEDAIISTIKRNGVLLIPAFAVERTQDLLYRMHKLQKSGRMPKVQVFLDSPMAIRVSEVIKRYPQYYDQEAFQKVVIGEDMFNFPGLHRTMSKDESKMINATPKPKVIIAGAGMMNGGRILHHLVRYLGDKKNTVLIVGYQAAGTLGRTLSSGERTVDILSERVQVNAQIVPIGAYSAHADQKKLVTWIGEAQTPPKRVFCTHGEEAAAAALATRITEELGIQADVPRVGETVDVG
jgi:metallo-beta-lactamase family protein